MQKQGFMSLGCLAIETDVTAVCLSVRLSHSCELQMPFDRMRCHSVEGTVMWPPTNTRYNTGDLVSRLLR